LCRQGQRLRLVGNLPYNISTPLLFHCIRQLEHIEDMTFMLQKEVADRLVARPGSREYGRLSVMVQHRCQAEVLFGVEPAAFFPRPEVRSQVLRLVPRASAEPLRDPMAFAALVRQAFSGRRKTVKNALKGQLSAEAFAAAGVDPGLRPEVLAVSDFVRLCEHLSPIARPGRGTC
jgi:16S rRNA (adenine1518-N6/adenine1519-N6)-dimethyltransferase